MSKSSVWNLNKLTDKQNSQINNVGNMLTVVLHVFIHGKESGYFLFKF